MVRVIATRYGRARSLAGRASECQGDPVTGLLPGPLARWPNDGRVLGEDARRHLVPGREGAGGRARGGTEGAGALRVRREQPQCTGKGGHVAHRDEEPGLAVPQLRREDGQGAGDDRRARLHGLAADEREALEARRDCYYRGAAHQAREDGPLELALEMDAGAEPV